MELCVQNQIFYSRKNKTTHLFTPLSRETTDLGWLLLNWIRTFHPFGMHLDLLNNQMCLLFLFEKYHNS